MSDVEAGGATVFPYLGLRLAPKKVRRDLKKIVVDVGRNLFCKPLRHIG